MVKDNSGGQRMMRDTGGIRTVLTHLHGTLSGTVSCLLLACNMDDVVSEMTEDDVRKRVEAHDALHFTASKHARQRVERLLAEIQGYDDSCTSLPPSSFTADLAFWYHKAVMFRVKVENISLEEVDGAREAYCRVLDRIQTRMSLDIEEVPNEFLCPITMSIMRDPVVASDGHTYERDAIMRHLSTNSLSPITQQPLDYMLFDNYSL